MNTIAHSITPLAPSSADTEFVLRIDEQLTPHTGLVLQTIRELVRQHRPDWPGITHETTAPVPDGSMVHFTVYLTGRTVFVFHPHSTQKLLHTLRALLAERFGPAGRETPKI